MCAPLRRQDGFTLIELLVVILIIGILLAVAAPSFIGQQKKAYDSKAKQALAVAYKQAKAVATDNEGSFVDQDTVYKGIKSGEPELAVATASALTGAASTDTVYVIQASSGNLLLAYRSKSGTVQTLTVTGNGAPSYASTTVAASSGGNYAALIGAEPTLVRWYRLGDSSGPAMTDSSSAGINGTYANVTLGAAGALTSGSDTAATFNGSTSAATFARPIQDDFTLEFWFKTSTAGGGTGQWYQGSALVDGEVGGATTDFGTAFDSSGRVMAGVGQPDTTILSSTSGLNDNNWHYVAFTRVRSSGAMTLYVDGSQVASGTGQTGALTAPSSLGIGRFGGYASGFFNGTIDEVAVYNSALSPAAISAHYAAR